MKPLVGYNTEPEIFFIDFFRFHKTCEAAQYLKKVNPDSYEVIMGLCFITIRELKPIKVNGVRCLDASKATKYIWESPETVVDLRERSRWVDYEKV